MGGRDFKKYFSFLKLNTKLFHKLHDYVEDYVGKVLVSVTQQSMRNKLVEEIKKSQVFFNVVRNDPSITTKIPIVIKLDMQWLQRGFQSPSGMIHAIGGLIDGIIGSKLIINKCMLYFKKKP